MFSERPDRSMEFQNHSLCFHQHHPLEASALGALTLIHIHKLTMTLLFSLEIDSRGSIVRKLVRKAFKKYLQKHMEFSICWLTFFMFLK